MYSGLGCSFSYSGGQGNIDQLFETMNASPFWDSGKSLCQKVKWKSSEISCKKKINNFLNNGMAY